MYDSVIIGSSPLCLLEAVCLRRAGRRVIVLDERDRPGGAWGNAGSGRHPFLDVGCHYWDVDREAYRFLRDRLGIPLAPLRPQPQFLWGPFRFPYDFKQIGRIVRDVGVFGRTGRFGEWMQAVFRTDYHRLRPFPFTATFLFPRGGAHAVMARLRTILSESGVEVRLATSLEEIVFEAGNRSVALGTSSGRLETRELVMTSLSRFVRRITPSPDLPEGCVIRRDPTHVNLILRDPRPRTFSYIRFLRHPDFDRATDVTDQLNHWGAGRAGRKALCVGVRGDWLRRHPPPSRDEAVLAGLRRHRLVHEAARIEASYWNVYPMEHLAPEARDALGRRFAPALRFLPTSNFITGVVRNLPRWKKAFPMTPERYVC